MNEIKFDLYKALIKFGTEGPASDWTLLDATQGVQIFGFNGAGKSSGSGKLIATKYLENEFGGLVLTCKPDEKDAWIEYGKRTNRLKDFIIVEPGGKEFFNLFQYMAKANRAAGITITRNIAETLKVALAAKNEKSGHGEDDKFWAAAQDMLLNSAIELCLLAFDTININDLYNIVMTAPKKGVETKDETNQDTFNFIYKKGSLKVGKLIEKYQNQLSAEERRTYAADDTLYERVILKAVPEAFILKQVHNFFFNVYHNLSEKTRSIVEFSFAGLLFAIMQQPFHSLFCEEESTFDLKDCLDGKVIILNVPTKIYLDAGQHIQVLIKYLFQKSMEQRNIKENDRPVFLYADESQEFLHPFDSSFQLTARSSRVCTVYLTQNLPNYYGNMGGEKSEYKVKSFLATLGTQIFHCNGDIDTNNYASQLMGQSYRKDANWGTSFGKDVSSNKNTSYKLEYNIRPEEFIRLRTGGLKNNLIVEAYIHRQSGPFSNGLNFKKISFNQQS